MDNQAGVVFETHLCLACSILMPYEVFLGVELRGFRNRVLVYRGISTITLFWRKLSSALVAFSSM